MTQLVKAEGLIKGLAFETNAQAAASLCRDLQRWMDTDNNANVALVCLEQANIKKDDLGIARWRIILAFSSAGNGRLLVEKSGRLAQDVLKARVYPSSSAKWTHWMDISDAATKLMNWQLV